jgi:hypothetical protein
MTLITLLIKAIHPTNYTNPNDSYLCVRSVSPPYLFVFSPSRNFTQKDTILTCDLKPPAAIMTLLPHALNSTPEQRALRTQIRDVLAEGLVKKIKNNTSKRRGQARNPNIMVDRIAKSLLPMPGADPCWIPDASSGIKIRALQSSVYLDVSGLKDAAAAVFVDTPFADVYMLMDALGLDGFVSGHQASALIAACDARTEYERSGSAADLRLVERYSPKTFKPPSPPLYIKRFLAGRRGYYVRYEVSHLCHCGHWNCYNPAHLTTEPAWLNMFRRWCLGPQDCECYRFSQSGLKCLTKGSMNI